MAKFDRVIEDLEYQIECHNAAITLGYAQEDPELDESLLKEWTEAIEYLRQAQ